MFNLNEAKERLKAASKHFDKMKMPLHEVNLSYSDTLKWKKDFDKLMKIYKSQSYRTSEEMISGFSGVKKMLEIYTANLKNHISRDFITVIDKQLSDYAKAKEVDSKSLKSTRDKLAFAYSDWLDALKSLIDYSDPTYWKYSGQDFLDQKTAEISFHLNDRMRQPFRAGTAERPLGLATEKAAEKLFKSMRDFIGYYGNDAREYDMTVTYPERVSFMGFSFINNIYYSEDDFKAMFGNMIAPLKTLKRLMPEVFYGLVYMEPQGHDQKNIQVGIMTIDAGGTYHPSADKVTLYAKGLKDWMSSAPSVLVHELAHRYYFKFMSSADRTRWIDFFERLKSEGASEYGDQNPEEDFAECILYYVYDKGVMKKKDVRDRVEAILNRRLRESKFIKESENADYQKHKTRSR